MSADAICSCGTPWRRAKSWDDDDDDDDDNITNRSVGLEIYTTQERMLYEFCWELIVLENYNIIHLYFMYVK
jgi:hypothetical protein